MTRTRLQTADGRARATLARAWGLDLPRPYFHLGRVVHASAELGLFRVQPTLLLGHDLTGANALGDWDWGGCAPGAEQAAALAELLAQARTALAGDAATLLVELPGWRGADGRSPFWDALGARFYPGDPTEARARLGEAWPQQLAQLLPRQTVYASFLGEAAERTLGRVAAEAEPWLPVLAAAGFQPSPSLCVDDGGPVWVRRPPPLG